MKKLLLGLLVVFLIGIVGTVVSVNTTGGLSFNTVTLHDKKVVQNEEIEKIEIDFTSTDIEVLPSDDDRFTIEVNGKVSEKLKDKFQLEVEEKDDLLKVKFKNPDTYFHIGISIVDTTVSVFLPTKLYESVTVHTASGDIEAEQIKASQFNVSAASGDIEIGGIEADRIFVTTASGDITVDDQQAVHSSFKASSGDMILTNVIGDVKAHNASGDISIFNDQSSGNITADASSGDVDIKFVKSPSSLYINFRSSSGDGIVELDGVSYDEKSDDRIIGTIGSGDHELIVDISSGDFTLR
ncbi:DUF4097 family beta strand repeat-containing protein [Cytobacillus sp. IB215665]|uniref:DUF4097 family beta strand repeat-containing protein n=1 Tax=Cytobacillus sp. IB215665 TaxID=3097357 RepID=UPI002A0F0020|nr:DUF4097 family beta strand repeat-containing protein [Cytobacillus sp. IB215665]MDX8366373.1 DUF4097 family beta strand repeat-containing protein [Cytobacillus sp. IB215665]